YTEQEKVQIALQYLLPRQIRENGLLPDEIAFEKEAVLKLIREYTREAGVRNLERQIGAVARKVATKIAEGKTEHVEIDKTDVEDLLGHPKAGYRMEIEERTDR